MAPKQPQPLTVEQKTLYTDNMKSLKKRSFCDGRVVDKDSLGPLVIGPFEAMGWDAFIDLEDKVCEYYVREFYSMFNYDMKSGIITFVLNKRLHELTLSEFGTHLGIPSEGLDLYCVGQSLVNLNHLIPRAEAKQLLCAKPNEINNHVFGRDFLEPHDLRYKIIDWNIFCRDGNHNEVSASSFGMVYCLEQCLQVNIAAFVAQRMKGVLSNGNRGLPYGMLLNSLFDKYCLPPKPIRKSKRKILGSETMSRMGKQAQGKRVRVESSESSEEEDDDIAQIERYHGGNEGASGSHAVEEEEESEEEEPADDFEDQTASEKLNRTYRELKAMKKEVSGIKKTLDGILDFLKCKGPKPKR